MALRHPFTGVGLGCFTVDYHSYAPPDAPLLLEFSGHPLAEVVRRFLKYSNNSIGEALVARGGGFTPGEPVGQIAFASFDLLEAFLEDGRDFVRESGQFLGLFVTFGH